MERALTCLRRASDSPSSTKSKPPPEWVLTSWEIEIGESISHGGFGEVLKATWLGHTQVAVKRLHVRLETSKLKEDFLREVKTWYPLRHPHIVPLLGACATAERPFMVSPLMGRGHALQFMDWCGQRDRNLIEVKAIKLLYEVSLGMQYLHARGVVHGDLKAVNILIDKNENAYVADFGFAALKQFTSTRNTGAGAASFGGTLRWMSPERLQGSKLSPPVDVYAYSMTCFELLSEGDVPFTDSPDALLYQHVVNAHLRPEKPSSCHETFAATSNQLFRLMQTCWSPDPLARPSF
ncbi:kinase-like domain-containing protein, partial [Chytriomyces cf. hyalinus JEL632]